MTEVKRFWAKPPGTMNYARAAADKLPALLRPDYHHRSVERIIAALDGNVPAELFSVLTRMEVPPGLDPKIHKRTILICLMKDHLLCDECLPDTKHLAESWMLDHSRTVVYHEVK